MKIKALSDFRSIKAGDIIEATVSKDKNRAVAWVHGGYDSVYFYNDSEPRFEIVDQPETEKQWCSVNDEKWYSLDELKQLKELFK